MPSCWACGSPVIGDQHACVECQSLGALKEIEGELAEQHLDENVMEVAQLAAMARVHATMEKGFGRIASAIRWGTETLQWELRKQADALKGIDQTLKTPAETQANEWRIMADELLRRGVLDDAQEFYRKALSVNRLDYRVYVGLAQTLIRQNAFQEADRVLERSLPHAPTANDRQAHVADWRSNSLRLQAHVRYCRDRYGEAIEKLQLAVQLSPRMHEAWYDLAQAAAADANPKVFSEALQVAIRENPSNWQLAVADAQLRTAPELTVTLQSIAQPILNETAIACKTSLEQLRNCRSVGLQVLRGQMLASNARLWIRVLKPRSLTTLMTAELERFEKECSSIEEQLRSVTQATRGLRIEAETYDRLRDLHVKANALGERVAEVNTQARLGSTRFENAATDLVANYNVTWIILFGVALMAAVMWLGATSGRPVPPTPVPLNDASNAWDMKDLDLKQAKVGV